MSESIIANTLRGNVPSPLSFQAGLQEARHTSPEEILRMREQREAEERKYWKQERARAVVAFAEKMMTDRGVPPSDALKLATEFASLAETYFAESIESVEEGV